MTLYREREKYMSVAPATLFGGLNNEIKKLESTLKASGFESEIDSRWFDSNPYVCQMDTSSIDANFLAFDALMNSIPKTGVQRGKTYLSSGMYRKKQRIWEDVTDWVVIGKVPLYGSETTTLPSVKMPAAVLQYAKAYQWTLRQPVWRRERNAAPNVKAIGYATNFLVEMPGFPTSLIKLSGSADAIWNEHISHPSPVMLSRGDSNDSRLYTIKGWNVSSDNVTQEGIESAVSVLCAIKNALELKLEQGKN